MLLLHVLVYYRPIVTFVTFMISLRRMQMFLLTYLLTYLLVLVLVTNFLLPKEFLLGHFFNLISHGLFIHCIQKITLTFVFVHNSWKK